MLSNHGCITRITDTGIDVIANEIEK